MSLYISVTPEQRAYQLQQLAKSRCPGCRSCAQLLMDHPYSVRLDCYMCGSAFEPNRPWARIVEWLPP